jgi:hypothetical protein
LLLVPHAVAEASSQHGLLLVPHAVAEASSQLQTV